MGNEVVIHVRADDDTKAGVASAKQGMGSMESSLGGVAAAATAAFSVDAALNFGGQMLNLAGQMEAWETKVDTVFEGQANAVRAWADKNNEAFGVTDDKLAGLAASFGDLLKPMGFTSDQAAEMSQEVVGLAGALSAWSGGTTSAEEATQILADAMLGERDALKQLGISISAAEVDARLLEKGQQDLTGAALQQAEAIATQELIMEKSTDAQEAWAKGGNEALKAQNEVKASVAELQEALAEDLAPELIDLTKRFVDIVVPVTDFADKLDDLGLTSNKVATFLMDVGQMELPDLLKSGGDDEEKFVGLRDRFAELSAEQEEVDATADEAADALLVVGDAAEVTAERVDELTESLDEILGRFLNVNASIADQNQKLADLFTNLDEMIAKDGEAAVTLDLATEAGRRNAEGLDELFRASSDTISAMVEQGATSEALRGQWAADRAELSLVIERFRAAGMDVSAYDQLLGEIDSLVATQLEVTGYEQAMARFSDIFDAVRAIPNFKQIHMGVTGYSGGAGGRAHGGIASGWTMVGEHGPELLNLPAGSSVRSNPDTERMLAGAGGGAHAVLELRSSGAPIDDFLIEMLRKAIRVQGGNVQLVLGRN